MAGRFSKAELKEKLQRSTFSLVASGGIESVTVRKVATGCGLSDPYIYQCYSDLTELMTDAFLTIDGEIASMVASVIKSQPDADGSDSEEIFWTIWSKYWKFLLSDPEKIIFYWRFYQSGYYSKELLAERINNFSTFTSFVYDMGEKNGINQKEKLDAAVSCIIDNTVSVVVKMHLGYLSEEDVLPQVIYGSAFSYLLRTAGIDVWEKMGHRQLQMQE